MDEQHPKVMVGGATGYIGGGVLQVLHQKGLWTRVLCRRKMMSGQAEVQQNLMGPLVSGVSLAEGFRQSIPIFEEFGMNMEVVDISNQGKDAVLEIQRVCPYMSLAREFGLQTPCQITCDMEVEAVQQAFPEMKGRILSKLACGDCVCVFKYERDTNLKD